MKYFSPQINLHFTNTQINHIWYWFSISFKTKAGERRDTKWKLLSSRMKLIIIQFNLTPKTICFFLPKCLSAKIITITTNHHKYHTIPWQWQAIIHSVSFNAHKHSATPHAAPPHGPQIKKGYRTWLTLQNSSYWILGTKGKKYLRTINTLFVYSFVERIKMLRFHLSKRRLFIAKVKSLKK